MLINSKYLRTNNYPTVLSLASYYDDNDCNHKYTRSMHIGDILINDTHILIGGDVIGNDRDKWRYSVLLLILNCKYVSRLDNTLRINYRNYSSINDCDNIKYMGEVNNK